MQRVCSGFKPGCVVPLTGERDEFTKTLNSIDDITVEVGEAIRTRRPSASARAFSQQGTVASNIARTATASANPGLDEDEGRDKTHCDEERDHVVRDNVSEDAFGDLDVIHHGGGHVPGTPAQNPSGRYTAQPLQRPTRMNATKV